ncbi:MAG: hypothetical protein EP330_25310 [Deltaproteobacteria bacterium]|nr:MAG: hypothetical protein EP330_25310 [Deltaproteobacteria bacterium]
MRSLTLPLLVLLVGCPAPDEVSFELEPTIELLYPPPDEPLIRQADGTVEFLVVVDIDNFNFDKEATGDPPLEGQGHYHVWIENDQVASPASLSETITHLPGSTPSLDGVSEVHIRVSLQNNDHSDYNDPDNDGVDLEHWESIVAYDIVDE